MHFANLRVAHIFFESSCTKTSDDSDGFLLQIVMQFVVYYIILYTVRVQKAPVERLRDAAHLRRPQAPKRVREGAEQAALGLGLGFVLSNRNNERSRKEAHNSLDTATSTRW